MNRDCYRLVYSDLLNAWVPVAETLPARGKRSQGARRLALAGVFLSLSGVVGAATLTPGTLPNCPAGVCGANFQPTVTLGGTGALSYQVNGTTGVINQNVAKVSATWNSFDIAANAAVTMNQPKGGAALFRVLGGQFGFTQIEGSLKVGYTEAGKFVPGGSLFLLNQNGVLFANGASVDAGTLVASSLRLSDDKFNSGILTDKNAAAFGDDNAATGFVKVDQGATLTAYAGGKILLLAPEVENRGAIVAPDGQVVVAAGSRVYLASSEDTSMRGLWVEVDNPDVAALTQDAGTGLPSGAGVAVNAATGTITTDRGNTTMIGLAVNQMGRISAKTAVATNGSIRLLARDTTVPADASSTRTNTATRAGKVTLGANSLTEALPDSGDTATSIDAQTFNASRVEVMGSSIELKSGAAIVAPGGKVSLMAGANPTLMAADGYNSGDNRPENASRILLNEGSVIDVSGSTLDLPMSRNVIAVELRGDELKDSPLLRYGVLRGTTVYIDIRKGTSVADISGYLAQTGRTVVERTTTGGTVTLSSEGDVITKASSLIDIGGGSINYQAGSISTSKLISGGKLYDIGSASAEMIYDAVVSKSTYTFADKWGNHSYNLAFSIASQEAAYTDYKAGGTVSITSPYVHLGGDVNGASGNGINQRASGANGGTLVIGNPSPSNGGLPDYRTLSDVVLTKALAALPSNWSATDPLDSASKSTLTLSTDMLARSGLANVKVYSNGKIMVAEDAALTLPSGGTLALTGNSVDVRSDVAIPAGTINLSATQTKFHDTDVSRLTVGPGVTLAARGMWVNDLLDAKLGNPLGSALIKGGSISLSSYDDLVLATGSMLDVSGGGQVSTAGKVSYGKGGDVSLTAQAGKGIGVTRPGGGMVLNGTVAGYSAQVGGSFSLTTGSVTIDAEGSNPFAANGALERAVAVLAADGRFAGDQRLAHDAIVDAVKAGTTEADVVAILQGRGYGADAITELRAGLAAMAQQLSGTSVIAATALTQGGFSNYSFTGLDGLTVSSGTALAPRTENLLVDATAAGNLATGGDLRTIATQAYLPDWQRTAASLALTAGSSSRVLQGNLVTGAQSSITTDPGASVTLTARNQMTLQGDISAAGGTVELTLEGSSESPAYDDINQSIWLTDGSRISVAGTFVRTDDGNRLLRGRSYAGGTTNINAKLGYVVTEADSLIDVSGSATRVDSSQAAGVSGVEATAGGSVSIAGRRGVYLDGRYSAAGGSSSVQGGTLTVALDSKNLTNVLFSNDGNARVLDVVGIGSALPTGLTPGAALDGVTAGSGAVRADRINSGDFSTVTLAAEDRIRFPGTVNLHTPLALTLNTPDVMVADGASITLASNAVTLRNSLNTGTTIPTAASLTPAIGTGTLDVTATTIDLLGPISLSGLATTTFTSQGDIRLGGILPSSTSVFSPYGALATAGDLTLAARRIYPTTLTQFEIESDGTVMFSRTGASSAIPYSVGGSLNAHAQDIVQDGVLRAPFGTIALNADGGLDLLPGSIISVSAEGTTIPFGLMQNGSEWAYDFGDRIALFSSPPKGKVSLSGADVDLRSGAIVNASGGGDLSAREFTSGPGGSKDVLADAGTYALLPSWTDSVAPLDYQANLTSNPLTGQRIYISGGSGLAAGYYTLLPAAYALQSGGYAIKLVSANVDVASTGSVTKLSGASTVSGYLVNADGSRSDTRWSTYTLTPASVVRTQSEYAETTATAFYTALAAANSATVPALPKDAGSIAFSASSSLALDGSLLLAAAAGGQPGSLDIAAPHIVVTAGDAVTTPVGTIAISAQKLNSYNIGSLMLGGTRSETDEKTTATVIADSVTVSNDSNSALNVSEVVLVAKDQVIVSDDAVIRAAGSKVSAPGTLLLASNTGGNDVAALVRLSTGSAPTISRNGAIPATSVDGQGRARGVFVGENARLTSTGVLQLDSLYGNTVDSAATLAASDITLAASRLAIGDGAGSIAGSLAITSSLLSSMVGLHSLSLRSFSSIDLYANDNGGVVGLPASTGLTQLTFDTPLLQSGEANVNGEFAAANILLTNTTGIAAPVSAGGSGSLTLTATGSASGSGRIVIGSGSKSIAGFESVGLIADRDIVTVGSGSLNVDQSAGGVLTMAAGLISGADGSQQSIASGGEVDIVSRGTTTPAVAGVGGSLDISGARIKQGGTIDLTGGTLSLSATGSSAGDNVELGLGSKTRARGIGKLIYDYLAQADAGTINLSSAHGDVMVDAGAEVSVAASGGMNAGTVTLSAAEGRAIVNGTLLGQGGTGGAGGSVAVDAGILGSGSSNDLAGLNSTLKQGGFNQSIDIRVRRGDLDVLAGDANRVTGRSVTLSTDDGDINIGGTIDASGATGGSIGLYARGAGNADGRVTLENGGRLLARGTGASSMGSTGNGGTVVLSGEGTVADQIRLDGGAIDVSAADAGAEPGTILLRAPRIATTSVAIAPISSTVFGTRMINVEANRVYSYNNSTGISLVSGSTNTGSAIGQSVLKSDNNAFMANAAAMESSLAGGRSDISVVLRPGVEIRNTGAINVSADVNLASGWRYGASQVAGTLTLRAGGNLNINFSINDGLSKVGTGATLLAGDSWSYRLVGGSDLGSAKPLDVVASASKGDVILAAGKSVRTGVGDIEVAAGRNVSLGDVSNPDAVVQTSSTASSIYTVGTAASYGSFSVLPEISLAENGGDVSIYATGNISSVGSNQLINNWFYRQGGENYLAAWGPNYDAIVKIPLVGALAGGNVNLSAGGSIINVSANASNSAYSFGDGSLNALGEGNLSVRSAQDVKGGVYFVANGLLDLRAGRDVDYARKYSGKAVYPILALMNASANVAAGNNLTLETVVNPTLLAISKGNFGSDGTFSDTVTPYYSTYLPTSSVALTATGGDLTLSNSKATIGTFANKMSGPLLLNQGSAAMSSVLYPGTLNAVALEGDYIQIGAMTLAASPVGNLNIVAAGSANIGGIDMRDIMNLPTLAQGVSGRSALIDKLLGESSDPNENHGGYTDPVSGVRTSLLHGNDTTPVTIYAENGDVVGGATVSLAKSAHVSAGRDIRDLDLSAQNLGADQATTLFAERDIIFSVARQANNELNSNDEMIKVAGDGVVTLTAGRNVDLGNSNGVVTVGNLYNPLLSASGASIVVTAGAAAGGDFTAILNAYVNPTTANSEWRTKYAPSLLSYVISETGNGSLTTESAWATFQTLSASQQAAFARKVFFAELKAAGDAYNSTSNPDTTYSRGYAAIETLFPAASTYEGDINLFLSQLKTQQGGNIHLFAPGGKVVVGLTNVPAELAKYKKSGGTENAIDDSASRLGIMTLRGGDIMAMTRGDFLVNQSRVFTLYGTDAINPENTSDILSWSTEGNIDAGKGKKTAVSAPPPVIRTDKQGNVYIDASAAVAGSGIGSLRTVASNGASNVDLIAPNGEVNAGDAGIRVSGNLTIAAQRVTGLDNIQVGGTSSGVSASGSGTTVASTAGLSSSEATRGADSAASALSGAKGVKEPTSIFNVEVAGYGDDDVKKKSERE